jgi:hypothetical protein
MQRTWLWVVVAVVVILLIYFFMGGGGEPTTEAPAEQAPATEPAEPAPSN